MWLVVCNVVVMVCRDVEMMMCSVVWCGVMSC